jgi:hypothetical protein
MQISDTVDALFRQKLPGWSTPIPPVKQVLSQVSGSAVLGRKSNIDGAQLFHHQCQLDVGIYDETCADRKE